MFIEPLNSSKNQVAGYFLVAFWKACRYARSIEFWDSWRTLIRTAKQSDAQSITGLFKHKKVI